MSYNTNDNFKTGNVLISPSMFPQVIRKRLRAHYEKYLPVWIKSLDFFIGSFKVLPYIYKHPTHEEEHEYHLRVKNSSYDNDIHRGLQRIANHIFGQPIGRDGLDDIIAMTNFSTNTGLKRTPDQFFRDLLIYKMLFAEVFVLVRPALFDDSFTDDERRVSGELWQPQIIYPHEVVVYKEFKNIVKEFVIIRQDDNKGFHFIEYTDTQIIKRDKKGAIIKVIDHNVGSIPVIRYLFDANRDGLGDSLVRDIVNIAQVILNIESTIVMDLVDQSFETVIIPMTTSNLKVLENFYDTNEAGKLQIKKKPIMAVGADGDISFHTRDLQHIDRKISYIESKRETIKEKLEERVARRVVESGLAKSIEEVNQRKALEFISTQANSDENRFWEFYIEISKANIKDWIVRYPSEFDVLMQAEMVDKLKTFIETVPVPEFVLEATNEYWRQIMKDFKTKDEIEETIAKVEKSRDVIRKALEDNITDPRPPTQRGDN